ncbi:hypothetical protein D3C78_1789640 [compost metagenome]
MRPHLEAEILNHTSDVRQFRADAGDQRGDARQGLPTDERAAFAGGRTRHGLETTEQIHGDLQQPSSAHRLKPARLID